MYRTVRNDYPAGQPFDFDMVILFTPAGFESLLANFPDFKERNIKLGCFGKATAKAIEEANYVIDLAAPTVKAPSMPASLEVYLEENA